VKCSLLLRTFRINGSFLGEAGDVSTASMTRTYPFCYIQSRIPYNRVYAEHPDIIIIVHDAESHWHGGP